MQSAVDNYLLEKIIAAVGRTMRVEPSALSRSTRLVDDLSLSGLARLRLALQLEDLFDMELQNDTVERFQTLGDIVNYFSFRYFRDVDATQSAMA